MPEITLALNVREAVSVHNRIAQMTEGSRGQRVQRSNFMNRLLDAFPEAKPDSGLPPVDPKATRPIKFSAEEQRAVSEGLIVLCSQREWTDPLGQKIPVTTADVQAVLKDAALVRLKAHVLKHLAQDAVEPFDGELDGDALEADKEAAAA